MSKQVFLYKPDTSLNASDLAALRDNGFIPIQVNEFDSIKIIDPLNEVDRSAVWLSAMEAISQANNSVGVKHLFGSLLAEKLSGCSV